MNRTIILLLTLVMGISCSEPLVINDEAVYNIIPYPKSLMPQSGSFELDENTRIVAKGKAKIIADLFIKKASLSTNYSFHYTDTPTDNCIIFELDEGIKDEEGYRLSISSQRILAKARTEKGLFYAYQTLRQLMPQAFESEEKQSETQWLIPAVEIEDEPRFAYRGTHLDVARHFFNRTDVNEFIDQLAYHKINYLHLHLTDDQGWRIEIKKYPKLTEISSVRKQTLIGHYNDQPHQFDSKEYGAYFTQNDIKAIVKYATQNHITIIPEIEMPGHAQAVFAAYPEFSCEPNKEFKVMEKWGVSDNVYCPTEATFKFLEDVIDEVIELFPGEYIHIGGDECPKTKWKESTFCQKLIKEKGLKDEHELQSYFIQRMEKYINSKGKKIIGWDEILEGGLAENATVMSWRGIEGGIAAAQQKHDVIMTPTSHCYLDYYQSTHPEEPLAIGGFLPLEKVYNFEPVPETLTEVEADYILGAQVNLWTEYITTKEQLEYMAFPRICALSELTWTPKEARDFKRFVPRIATHIERLKLMGINSANHLYEIISETESDSGIVHLALSTLGDARIYYTIDDSLPSESSFLYKKRVKIDKTSTIRAQAFRNGVAIGRSWKETFIIHKAAGKSIQLKNQPHEKYQGGGNTSIINGVLGSNSRYGDAEWLGFDGKNCEAVIDFGEEKVYGRFSFRNFDGEGQWIYLPKSVTLYQSDDGESFAKIYQEKIKKTGEKVVETSFELYPKRSRYLKVVFENYGIIPEGNQGAGNPAWLFVDEIIIN